MFMKIGMPARLRAVIESIRSLLPHHRQEENAQLFNELAKEQEEQKERFDASFSSGGIKATLGGIGFALLLRVAGLDKQLDCVLGNSGGFAPAACLKSSLPTRVMMHKNVYVDHGTMLTPTTGLLRRLWAIVRKPRLEIIRPEKGVFSSHNLGTVIDEVIADRGTKTWPHHLMTVATTKEGNMVVIACDGAYEYLPDGSRSKLADKPCSMGDAARATAAIPGIISAITLWGKLLFDGVLCGDGRCQIRPIHQHYTDRGYRMFVFDVGEDAIKKSIWMRLLWYVFSLGSGAPLESQHPKESDKVIVINCKITGFNGLNMGLDLTQKWRAIIAGYLAGAKRLRKADIISRETHPQVYELAHGFRRALRQKAALPKLYALGLALKNAMQAQGVLPKIKALRQELKRDYEQASTLPRVAEKLLEARGLW